MDLIVALQSAASPALDRFMMLVTNLGSEQVYVAILVIAFVGLSARNGRSLAIYFLAGVYLMELLKLLFDAPRPFQLDPSVLRSSAAADTAAGASFPSGHALSAMLLWALAASYVRRTWFSVLAALIVGLVAVSRLYLGVHFPLDVVVGLALGLAFAFAGRALDRVKWNLSLPAVAALGVFVPLVLHLVLPTANSGLYMGALAAFVVGPELVRHSTDGPLVGRLVLIVIGLALVFAALMGSSVAIPDAIRHSPVGAFVRYLLIGAVGAVLVPLIGRWTGLVPKPALREADVQAPARSG